MKRFIVLMMSFMASFGTAFSQHTVSGKIFDQVTKEPLPGVSIVIPHILNATTANSNGLFILKSEQPIDSIEIRFIGYKTIRFKVENKEPLNIIMEPSVTNIQEVVVTASRDAQPRSEVPLAISKISATTINDTKATLLTELINKVPGVVMLNLNNEQHGMSIRQPMGTSNYFLYMEDGIPLRPMGVFNHNALIEMNLLAISGIEIVKGPASSVYGPEAVGGAINFITQKPTAVPTVRAGMQFDNYGYRRVQYGTGGPITKKIGIYLGGFNALQRNGWMTNSDYNKNSLNVRIDYRKSERTNIVLAGAFNDYYSQTGGSVDSNAFYSRKYISSTDFTYRKVRSLRSRLSFNHKWNDNNNTILHLFYRNNSIGQNPAYAIRWKTGQTTAAGQVNENNLVSYGAILQHSLNIERLNTKITSGLSLDHSPANYNAYQIDLAAQLRPGGLSVETYTINKERQDLLLADYSSLLLNYAAYAQAEIKPLKNLTVTLGGRFDVMSFDYENYIDDSKGKKSFEQFSPKAGATYKITRNTGVYVNYAKGFAPPGLTTIFAKRPDSNPAEFYYNITPAQFTNYEAGGWISIFKNKLDLDVSFYKLSGRNELLNIRQPDNSTDYQSAGKTTHEGIEYGIVFRPTYDLMFRLSGTNAMHRFDEFILSTKPSDAVKDVNGKLMPSAPSSVINTEVVFKPEFIKGVRIGAEWQYISSWYQDQLNQVKYKDKGAFGLEGISVINIRGGYEWKSLEIFCNVMNVSDELYAFNATRGNLTSSRTTYTPAPPRTFVFGFQYNFTRKQ